MENALFAGIKWLMRDFKSLGAYTYVLREEVQLTNSICDSQFSCCQFCCCCVGVAANCSWCPAQRKAAVVGEASAALAAAVKNVANNNKDIL